MMENFHLPQTVQYLFILFIRNNVVTEDFADFTSAFNNSDNLISNESNVTSSNASSNQVSPIELNSGASPQHQMHPSMFYQSPMNTFVNQQPNMSSAMPPSLMSQVQSTMPMMPAQNLVMKTQIMPNASQNNQNVVAGNVMGQQLIMGNNLMTGGQNTSAMFGNSSTAQPMQPAQNNLFLQQSQMNSLMQSTVTHTNGLMGSVGMSPMQQVNYFSSILRSEVIC